MSFEGYKYTFRLNASHFATSNSESVHSHTFQICIYIQIDKKAFTPYDLTENMIKDYLNTYTNVVLNNVPPFNVIPPTIENMGEEFFIEISKIMKEFGFKLTSLEISDTPQRTYSVNDKDLSKLQRKNLYSELEKIENSIKLNPEKPVKNVPEINTEIETKITTETTNIEPPKETIKKHFDKPSTFETINKKTNIFFILSILFMILSGLAVMLAVRFSEIYPLGLDIHGHLFKADLMYNEIKSGNLYPLYTRYWYNGLQPFRYWPPMPYYFMALIQFICSGNIMNAYLGFIWASFSIGGIGWVLFTRKINKPILGLVLGILWFMLPDNLRVFFGEGNLPRMFVTMLIPYVLYFLWQFVNYRKKKMIFPLIIFMIISIFGHLMISAMIGVASAIFLFIYIIANKRIKESFIAILAMLFSFAVAGIWVYPSLVGGITSMGSDGTSQLMASLSAKLSVSLNPFLRLDGSVTELYFGLSVALVAFVGIFLSNKKSLPGFCTILIIILGTTTALTPLIQKLPLSELFWVRRFTPIAYAMFVIAIIEWKKIKKSILIVMCSLIILDCIPSFNLSEYDKRMNIPATINDIDKSMDNNLFSLAKENTKQRVSLMDLSILGPMPSYAFGTLENKTQYVFGWAWQGAATANNIAYLNESLEKEKYLYMFDRNMELGADTVIIDKIQLKDDDERQKLETAATQVGYKLSGETSRTLMFSLDVNSTFGLVTKYNALAIGSTSQLVAEILPNYQPGDKLIIDDYTVSELEQYDKIYLSGFFYNDKTKAENLVRQLADSGVKIYIDMNRIPQDPLTSRMTFLNVSAQPIKFYNNFPKLITEDDVVSPKSFANGYEQWNTVYLTNLEESTGYSWFEETKLNFCGTGDTKNITFIGFNLLFHTYTSDDYDVKNILNSIMDIDDGSLPERTIVPLEINYETNKIIIKSEYDNVNTTIAYQDTFNSDNNISDTNNFLIVDKGTTIITMKYPYFMEGLIVSIIGILLEFFLIYFYFKKEKTIKL